MQLKLTTVVLLAVAASPALTRSVQPKQPRQQSFDAGAWLLNQNPISWSSIYKNIGPSGDYAKSAVAGTVIASPSTANPDYYYQWTRDSALVSKTILTSHLRSPQQHHDAHLRAYAVLAQRLQRTPNPSGGEFTGAPGEPKFYVDGSPYWGAWGRPQPDGPALRALVLSLWAESLLAANPNDAFVRDVLYTPIMPARSTIKADLEYVSHNWARNDAFDLWEEQRGVHFFGLMVSHRALLVGANIARKMGDTAAADWYAQQAGAVRTALLNRFWDAGKGYLKATEQHPRGFSALDCGTALGSLHGRGTGLFEPWDAKILSTVDRLANAMKPLYAINAGKRGVAIGRYTEDVYDGDGTSIGHPWFLCTAATASVAYIASDHLSKQASITVPSDGVALDWYKRFEGSASPGRVYNNGTDGYRNIVAGMRAWGDNQIEVIATHAARNGSMSEQFDRWTGLMRGARDLTWSFSEVLGAEWARGGVQAL